MARGVFFEISMDPENIGNMTEEDFYGSDEGAYFEDSRDSSEDIRTLFKSFNLYGIETGQGQEDGLYYVVFTEKGKENWFKEQFLNFQALTESMDLKTFSTTSMYNLKRAICDNWSDAVYLGSCLYPMDDFIREAECNKKYFLGNTVLAH